MTTYKSPAGEYGFLAAHVFASEYQQMPDSDRADADTLTTILERLGEFVSDRVVPIAVSADVEGCSLVEGQARAPKAYREAYRDLIFNGWASLHVAQEHGGQGLPLAVAMACDEVISSGAMSLSLYLSLRLGVYKVLEDLGSEYLKTTYLRRIGSGQWNATMCLTEPQCGTDLSLLRASATEMQDGTYRLSGTKIFITGGDHDLTENIVHLVLARVKGAPEGFSGLGLFVVPKWRNSGDGNWDVHNGVTTARLENKLGIHASATAELVFDGANGWIVGKPGAGLAGMFTLMKLARVGTAFQAIGVAELAVQKATAYALDRIQGRDVVTGKKQSVPIVEHPNVKRELVRMRTMTTTARMLAFFAAVTQDRSSSPDAKQAAEVAPLLAVLMPVTKVVASEWGVEVATAAMQTFGGHGYVRETGIEGLLRDVQVLPIYEGTNDVQSLDLVLRRLEDGLPELVALQREWVAEVPASAFKSRVCKTFDLIDFAAEDLARRRNSFSALQMAREFLWLVGHGVMGALWLRVLDVLDRSGDLPSVDRKAKLSEAAFYFSYLHPDADLRAARLSAAGEIEEALLSHPIQTA